MNPQQRLELMRRLKAAAHAVQLGRFADGELLARECAGELAEFMATSGAPTIPPPPGAQQAPAWDLTTEDFRRLSPGIGISIDSDMVFY